MCSDIAIDICIHVRCSFRFHRGDFVVLRPGIGDPEVAHIGQLEDRDVPEAWFYTTATGKPPKQREVNVRYFMPDAGVGAGQFEFRDRGVWSVNHLCIHCPLDLQRCQVLPDRTVIPRSFQELAAADGFTVSALYLEKMGLEMASPESKSVPEQQQEEDEEKGESRSDSAAAAEESDEEKKEMAECGVCHKTLPVSEFVECSGQRCSAEAHRCQILRRCPDFDLEEQDWFCDPESGWTSCLQRKRKFSHYIELEKACAAEDSDIEMED